MRFEFEGLEELISKLEQKAEDVEKTKNEALQEGAKVMQKAAQDKAPYRTGNLKRHIEISDIKDGEINVYVDQQGKAYYGYFQEFGTSKMRARPFMGPAFNASKLKIQRVMADRIRQRLMSP